MNSILPKKQLIYMDTGIDIPLHWRLQKLKFFSTLIMGQSTDSASYNYKNVGTPFLQGKAEFGVSHPTPSVYSESANKYALKDDILISVRAPVGDLNIADQIYGIGRGLCAIRAFKEVCNKTFIRYFLEVGKIELFSIANGSTYDAVTIAQVANILCPIPPVSEQELICEYLDQETTEIDALIAEKEHMLNLLDEKREALISRAFTRGINSNISLKPSGITWLGDVPQHWGIRRGKYLFSQSSLPVRETDEIVTCFRDGQVTLRKNRREDGFTNAILELGYQGIRQGQLVLHSMDAFAGAIGISDSDGKCSPEYIICDPLFDEVDSQYYGLLLRVMALRGYIQAACTAVRERAPRIRFSHIANMFLPLPPISEQQDIVKAIGREIDSTKELVSALTDSIILLKERRSALITAAVTGQIAMEDMVI
jgi:type I restriction enzyme, S subunit